MRSKITKWGNSYGVRIPRALVEKLKLQETEVDLILEGKGVKLVPVKKPKVTLKSLLAGMTEENKHDLIEKDGPRGNEIW